MWARQKEQEQKEEKEEEEEEEEEEERGWRHHGGLTIRRDSWMAVLAVPWRGSQALSHLAG